MTSRSVMVVSFIHSGRGRHEHDPGDQAHAGPQRGATAALRPGIFGV